MNGGESHHDHDAGTTVAPHNDLLDERVLCGSCMTVNRPIDPFCRQCGCPIGQYAATDPFLYIQTMGWGFRRAITPRVTLGMLIAMWLIFIPAMLFGHPNFIASSGHGVPIPLDKDDAVVIRLGPNPTPPPAPTIVEKAFLWFGVIGAFTLSLALLWVHIVMLYKVTRAYRQGETSSIR